MALSCVLRDIKVIFPLFPKFIEVWTHQIRQKWRAERQNMLCNARVGTDWRKRLCQRPGNYSITWLLLQTTHKQHHRVSKTNVFLDSADFWNKGKYTNVDTIQKSRSPTAWVLVATLVTNCKRWNTTNRGDTTILYTQDQRCQSQLPHSAKATQPLLIGTQKTTIHGYSSMENFGGTISQPQRNGRHKAAAWNTPQKGTRMPHLQSCKTPVTSSNNKETDNQMRWCQDLQRTFQTY